MKPRPLFGMPLAAQLWPSDPEKRAALVRASAPRFIFLHGMGGTGALWRPIAAQLEDQALVLAPDQRGHGQSRPAREAPSPLETYSPLAYGADVLATMDQHQWESAWLIGHSMGVRTAAAAAHLDPARVRGLVLVDLGLSGAAGGGLGDTLARFIEKLPERFASRANAREFMNRECPDPAIAQYLMAVSTLEPSGEISFPFDHAALIATIDAARDSSVRDWLLPLAQNGMPMLLLRGARSLVLSAQEFADEAALFNPYPNVTFETFENAGHGLPFEQRALFVDRLRARGKVDKAT